MTEEKKLYLRHFWNVKFAGQIPHKISTNSLFLRLNIEHWTIKHVSVLKLKFFDNNIISPMAMFGPWILLDSWLFISHFVVQTKCCQCSKRRILFLIVGAVILRLKYILSFREPTIRLRMTILVRTFGKIMTLNFFIISFSFSKKITYLISMKWQPNILNIKA